MNTIHLKRGLSPRMAGAPPRQLRQLETPRQVGLVPHRIPFIKPRLLVEEGDAVAIGTPLFEDKRDTRVRFVSPGGGRVERIAFGPRRTIRRIVIALDAEERRAPVVLPDSDRPEEASRPSLVGALLSGGVWPFLRALPFMDIASPDDTPPAIIVRLGDDEPFAPDPVVYLQGREERFGAGIDVLRALAPRVVIHLTGDAAIRSMLPGAVDVRRFTGPYPTGNPCVQLYRTKRGAQENRAWFIDGQDVIHVGAFMRTGHYPVTRVVSVGGGLASGAGHVVTRAGAPLRLLCGDRPAAGPSARTIVGGLFTGFAATPDGFMGYYQNALNLVDDGDREEPFAFIRPGVRKPSYSRAFLSALSRRPLDVDCGQHGEVRACVNCGTCAAICPVDILPQFTMKCLVADEVEEALAHGLLDCAECGLCTYACPSKIELREVLRAAKAQYYKEIA